MNQKTLFCYSNKAQPWPSCSALSPMAPFMSAFYSKITGVVDVTQMHQRPLHLHWLELFLQPSNAHTHFTHHHPGNTLPTSPRATGGAPPSPPSQVLKPSTCFSPVTFTSDVPHYSYECTPCTTALAKQEGRPLGPSE